MTSPLLSASLPSKARLERINRNVINMCIHWYEHCLPKFLFSELYTSLFLTTHIHTVSPFTLLWLYVGLSNIMNFHLKLTSATDKGNNNLALNGWHGQEQVQMGFLKLGRLSPKASTLNIVQSNYESLKDCFGVRACESFQETNKGIYKARVEWIRL